MQQYTYRNLGVSEVEDQLAVVKYLKSLPYIDKQRVGSVGLLCGVVFMVANAVAVVPVA